MNDRLARGEVFLLSWLEENAYHVDLFTDIDFHNGIPPDYRKLILSTHPNIDAGQFHAAQTDDDPRGQVRRWTPKRTPTAY